ncbi:hypothetical protein DFJ43DRAFT_1099781 [Lentinula guzmanii]|uniref:Peptidase A2 domain-containing protein n=1 Tax=Lentinula guzmanii TaxID=2804957 RepID=A0AA38MR93_9AGAR|nr:hypothetical protein DFJ43DRAFT_1099781 [Lentinula guzmanii]
MQFAAFIFLAVAYSALALPFKNAEVSDTIEAYITQTMTIASLPIPTPMIFAKVAWDLLIDTGAAPIFAKDQWEPETSRLDVAAASTTTPTSIILRKMLGRTPAASIATSAASVQSTPLIFAKEAWESDNVAIFAKDQWEAETAVTEAPTSLPAALIFAKDAW